VTKLKTTVPDELGACSKLAVSKTAVAMIKKFNITKQANY
jgi:hypothetical protein